MPQITLTTEQADVLSGILQYLIHSKNNTDVIEDIDHGGYSTDPEKVGCLDEDDALNQVRWNKWFTKTIEEIQWATKFDQYVKELELGVRSTLEFLENASMHIPSRDIDDPRWSAQMLIIEAIDKF